MKTVHIPEHREWFLAGHAADGELLTMYDGYIYRSETTAQGRADEINARRPPQSHVWVGFRDVAAHDECEIAVMTFPGAL